MPELAEVAYYCSRWNPALGQIVKSVVAHGETRCFRDANASVVANALLGKRFLSSRTHGKRMLFEFSGGYWLGLHLGMTGRLLIRGEGVELERHDHLALQARAGWLVFNDPRQFGSVELHESPDLPEFWRRLPTEVLSEEYNYAYFESLLSKRGRATVKPLLLNQECFPGVGNWMADEILWRARIRPDRKLDSLSAKERRALYKALKFVCHGAMRYVATDYSDPPKSWLFRHRWKPGGVCPKTGQPLERSSIGGRTTCWSPEWQR